MREDKKFTAPKQSDTHGKVSLKDELADGVYMVTTRALLKVVMVAQSLASKLMSKCGRDLGEVDGDYLSYPVENGKSSIPLFELAQRGYLKADKNIGEHLRNLIQKVPEYLRSREVTPRPLNTMANKVEAEYQAYIKEVSKLSKTEILERASEIAKMERVKNEIVSGKLNHHQRFGRLIVMSNLLNRLCNELDNPENINRLDCAIIEPSYEISSDKLDMYMNSFKQEIDSAQIPIQSVSLCLESPEGKHHFQMNWEDFRLYLDDAMLERFAEVEMLDFPHIDYFGTGFEQVFKQLQEKRFLESVQQHFNDYAPQGAKDLSLTIEAVSQEVVAENQFDGLLNRFKLQEYILANYENPASSHTVLQEYFQSQKSTIDELQRIVSDKQSIEDEQQVTFFDEEIESEELEVG